MKKKHYLVVLIVFFVTTIFSQDTTVVTIGSDLIQDAMIVSNVFEPDGNNPSLVCSYWNYTESAEWARSLLSFDLSAIPERSVITSASLSLFHNNSDEYFGHSNLGGENSGVILRLAEEWSDDLVTWENQPKTSIVNAVVISAPDSENQDYPQIDVTDIVQNFVDHPDNSNGILIKLFSEFMVNRSLVFASVDNANDLIKPQLNISYIQNVHHDTIIILQPNAEDGKDAYINTVYNYPSGSRPSLIESVWNYFEGIGTGRSLLEFNVSELPEEFVLFKAELSLFHDSASVHIGHSTAGGSNSLLVQRVISPWEENSVYWYNQPEATNNNQVLLPATHFENQDYLNIDVTDLMKDIFAEGNFGMLLRLENESYDDFNRSVVLASSDHEDMELWPKLELVFVNTSSINKQPISSLNYKVFPNPTKGIVSVELSKKASSPGEYSVINLNGSIVLSGNFSAKKFTIDTASLPKGMYAIQLIDNGSVSIQKLIIL